jgi:type I restriction enzyme R subunit
MGQKEAKARIKINRLLEESGWRFFDTADGPANIQLELHTKITEKEFDALGDDFESTRHGYLDFLLLDERGYPLIVLEAKKEDLNPLVGKEQARKYAKSQNCRFVILSNGNLHYFWDLERGNPYVITQFPKPWSVRGYQTTTPNPKRLIEEPVDRDFIVQTQYPNYQQEAAWKNEKERPAFEEKNSLRFLREYQVRAVRALQKSVAEGNDRFLFEMATGTGKTLIAAAVIKLLLKTGNAKRVLFLVDRLELEDQANKRFVQFLRHDFKTVVYKENREDWRKAEIVVTTVQSLLFNNKYKKLFSPTDFDLIISDEAHRSIGGNARAVFEYFIGYKLGLTATPRDYLKKFDHANARDPRELERRILMDTYRTFGCEGGQPTFRYSLLDGVRDGFLINPVVVDARTDVTTQLLSDEGYAAIVETEEGEEQEETFFQRSFEKKFFSEDTNYLFCKTFLEKALRDPISGEVGKTIVFAVSQNHAAKLAQILNELADQIFPGKYQSDFAMQVTSSVTDAQQFTINFANNNLGGSANFISNYKTSKTRVCVTVGMMTTGYDCEDILNLCLMRPIFSPTDFIQIKGRGTRTFEFTRTLFDEQRKSDVGQAQKTRFKLFDFFGNCEYFEEKFNYDEILKLPYRSKTGSGGGGEGGEGPFVIEGYERFDPDVLKSIQEQQVGMEGMKIDRMFFEKFEERVQQDAFIQENVEQGNWERIVEYVSTHILDKPEEFFTLDKLRKAAGIDRRLSLREIIEKAYGFIQQFKSKDDLLEEEFEKFVADAKPDKPDIIIPLKYFFKAYITDTQVREIIESKRLTELNTNPTFTMQDFKAVPAVWRERVPEYIKDYVPLNQFMG